MELEQNINQSNKEVMKLLTKFYEDMRGCEQDPSRSMKQLNLTINTSINVIKIATNGTKSST